MEQQLSQSQEQTQQLTQVQNLTPNQILYVKLLELPALELENRIQKELADNSALEESGDEPEESDLSESEEGLDRSELERDGEDEGWGEDDWKDYLGEDEDELPPVQCVVEDVSPMPIGAQESFNESLLNQIGEYDVNNKERSLIEYLIGSLDDDGLLRKRLDVLSDELAVYHNIDATENELQAALRILQRFDPPGIAATSLQECLLIQLQRIERPTPTTELAQKILTRHFDDFIHKHYDHIQHVYNLDSEQWGGVLHILCRLNPKPGNSVGENGGERSVPIIPDFNVTSHADGHFEITLNRGNQPTLQVSKAYQNSVDDYQKNRKILSDKQKEEMAYMKKNIDSAEKFITAIKQRNDTLLRIMHAIVSHQREFFEDGDEQLLHPMILKDIADDTGIDISSVSRASQSKYVSTPYGTFPLKYFFNNSFVSSTGTTMSKNQIKTTLRTLIEGEDKAHPLADEDLARELKQAGLEVARRTIAKYREQMGFPVARLRKQ